ncbi:MAG: formate hydrogenlyase, partial [Thermoproteota archaeon]
MEFALLQAVFLPLLLSPVAYIIGRKAGTNSATWFTFGVLLYCTVLLVLASLEGKYEEHYPWTNLFGEFGFLL